MQQTYSVLMKKKDDSMARFYGHLAGRGLHFRHASAAVTEDGDHWRMTLVIDPDETCPEKLVRELNRLMDVLSVTNLTDTDSVSRQYALLGVQVDREDRGFVRQLAEMVEARVLQDTPEEMVLEMTGCQGAIDAFVGNLRSVGQVRMNCTGPVALDDLGVAEDVPVTYDYSLAYTA